ncbi:8495_t:CDS:1, partial [Paraglomus brasilianum]
DLKEHYYYACALDYARWCLSLQTSGVIYFNCEDDATTKLNWPTEGQVIAGLNCAVFWHNLQFNEVQMTALFKNEDREVQLV